MVSVKTKVVQGFFVEEGLGMREKSKMMHLLNDASNLAPCDSTLNNTQSGQFNIR